jgi:hypothetical protein
MATRPLINAMVWMAFAGATVLATAPVWVRLAYGFNPTLDEVLRVARCVPPV